MAIAAIVAVVGMVLVARFVDEVDVAVGLVGGLTALVGTVVGAVKNGAFGQRR